MISERIKRLFTNFAISSLSLFFSLLVAEALLRIFSPGPPPVPPIVHHKLFCEYDPLLGWRKIPNISEKFVTYEYSVLETFNSKGIRGPEYSYSKGDNEYRILVLGDSFAEGFTVEFDDLFSEGLKRELNGKGNRYYEVINTGTVGYSNDQELLFFQSEGKKYNPDLTILMFFENDVWYNNQKYWRVHKPLFVLEDGELRLTNVPVPEPDAPAPDSGAPKSDAGPKQTLPLQGIKDWLSKNSHLYRFAVTRIKNTYQLYALAIKLGLVESKSAVFSQESVPILNEFGVWQKPYNEECRAAWEITEAIIVELQEETASIGSELLIFYIPPRASIYDEEWRATKIKYGLDETWNIEQAGIELEAVCKRHGIDFINATEPFRAEADELKTEGERLYFVEDAHWNVNGHRVAGEILAEYVDSNY